MEIKTKPATKEYINNFDTIFKNVPKETPMKRYRVPFDVFGYAIDAERAERLSYDFMQMALKDIGPTYNITSFVAPVGYPTEEDILGTTT